MGTILFEETQRFRQWWVWLISLLAIAFPVTMVIIVGTDEDSSDATHTIPLIFSVLIPVFIILLLFFMRLTTRITTTGISYRFFPVHAKFREIPFAEISEMYVRKYSPLYEFGGWGIRYTIRNGKAYNVGGRQGIQLVLKNGNRLLIGTQRSEEALKAINDAGF